MHHHTLDVYYKLLLAVCATEFSYEPFGDNGHIPAKLNRYIASYNRLDVSVKTLRNHLVDAEAHFARKGVLKRKA